MIRVKNIKVLLDEELKEKIFKKTGLKKDDIKEIKIIKKSLDARRENNIHYVYEVDLKLADENKIKFTDDIIKSPDEEFKFKITGNKIMNKRPVIVGSGPAGLFCAYILAENNYKPIIIERGEEVDKRIKSVNRFWKENVLNENSNVQFGEGGAGTFSDGKLNTLIKDKEFIGKKVFEIFVENGANEEIMYEKNPHIGTDKLVNIIKNIRNKIINMGGEFRFNSQLTDININNNKIDSIIINDSEIIKTETLILAIGHSARDTFKMLYNNGLIMTQKPFAVGIRIQHPQEFINKSQYKKYYKELPNANYKLTYQSKSNRGVYSFCMCPGGYVVNSSSEKNHLVINGMSYHKRDSLNANSALVVSVSAKDFEDDLWGGLNFQKELEKKAYDYANGLIPIQLLKDFYLDKKTTELKSVKPIFKGNYSFANINDILPKFICDDLKKAINYFDKKIKGFKMDDAIISAVESRTSSPIRIIRDKNLMSNIKGIYPVGEGAGYAGGITTSSIDGIKAAISISKIYKGVKDE